MQFKTFFCMFFSWTAALGWKQSHTCVCIFLYRSIIIIIYYCHKFRRLFGLSICMLSPTVISICICFCFLLFFWDATAERCWVFKGSEELNITHFPLSLWKVWRECKINCVPQWKNVSNIYQLSAVDYTRAMQFLNNKTHFGTITTADRTC